MFLHCGPKLGVVGFGGPSSDAIGGRATMDWSQISPACVSLPKCIDFIFLQYFKYMMCIFILDVDSIHGGIEHLIAVSTYHSYPWVSQK